MESFVHFTVEFSGYPLAWTGLDRRPKKNPAYRRSFREKDLVDPGETHQQQVNRHLDQASVDLFNYWGASEEIEDQLEKVFHQKGYRRTLIPEICGFRIFRKKKTAAHAYKIN